MTKSTRSIAASVIAASVAVGVLVAPSPAMAESASALCGSGYYNIDSHQLIHDGTLVGTIYLSYNGSDDCVVTEKNILTSVKTYTDAYVWPANDNVGTWDGDDYYSYAGPVRAYAKGECIQWGGEAAWSSEHYYDYVEWDSSPNSHCG